MGFKIQMTGSGSESANRLNVSSGGILADAKISCNLGFCDLKPLV